MTGTPTVPDQTDQTDQAAQAVAGPVQLTRPRRRRLRRILGVSLGAAFILSAVVIPTLPLVTDSTGPIKSSTTRTVPDQNAGVYLDTGTGIMQLFTWAMPLDQFPGDAQTLPQGGIRRIVVVQKAFSSVSDYILYRFDDHSQIDWGSSSVRGKELTLIPEALPAGRYLLLCPSDSSFGGTLYQYFVVGAARKGAG